MKIKVTNENTVKLDKNEIFVFGSNLAGIHGAGAALLAKNSFGAIQGIGEGLTGQCYALPTKDKEIQTLSLNEIYKSIEVLREVVLNNKDKFFIVTAIGCGLAGYEAKDIAPMFESFITLENISLPQSFIDVIFPKKILGYKVTDKNMKCRDVQFTMNKKHSVKGNIVICNNGFHFCKKLVDCFNYYTFTTENRVFEVEGYGDYDFNDNKVAVREIKFVRELNWHEVLTLSNTGVGNSGKSNSGYRNSGYRNSGNRNSGNRNSGYRNSGYRNSGNRNSGDYNSGNRNSGNRNSGDYNSGDYNSGNRNSGDYNSGDYNSGDYNSGNRNSGDFNSGNRNSGYFNSGNRNSGYFNSDEPTMRLFGKDSGLKNNELNIPYIYLSTTEWIGEEKMTDEEKKENPKFFTTQGYLKTISYKDAWKIVWENLEETEKNKFLNLPNFDASIFEEITGIKV